MTVFRSVLCATAALSMFATPALAQDRDAPEERETVGQIIDRMLRETEGSRKELAERGRDAAETAAETAEEAITESDIVASMSDLMRELSDKLEVERGEGNGTALLFDGEEWLRFRRELDREIDDRVTISGLGRNLSVERETVTKNGKTKTRIVIEMDGGEQLEIDLPGAQAEPTDIPGSDQE